jgi:hypothetical protein
MAYSAIGKGIIPDLSPGRSISADYVTPDIDLSMIPTAAAVAASLV